MAEPATNDVPWRALMLVNSVIWTTVMIAVALSENDLMIGFCSVALAIHIVAFLAMMYFTRHIGRTLLNQRWIVVHKINIVSLAIISVVVAASQFFALAFMTWNAFLINLHYCVVYSEKTTALIML